VCLLNIIVFYFTYLQFLQHHSYLPVTGFFAGLLSQVCLFGISTNEELTNNYDRIYEAYIDVYIVASVVHCGISWYLREVSDRRRGVVVTMVSASLALEVGIRVLDYMRVTSIVFDRLSECLFVLVITVYNATLHLSNP
jgi:hypothetical protein